MEYDLIEEFQQDYALFIKRVNEALQSGWRLHGPTQIVTDTDPNVRSGYNLRYFQAVVCGDEVHVAVGGYGAFGG